MPDVETVLQAMAAQGYRLTGPREAVTTAVLLRQEPFTSAELWQAIQAEAPAIGRATVFRTLDLLVRLGVVQRIHADAETGRCHAYLACDVDHHHHLICSGCGTVTDFHEEAALDALARLIAQRTDYRIEGHRLELIGRCPACQMASAD